MFIGIPLAEAVVEKLETVRARLYRRGDGLRWAARESWHITLQFLGETSAEQYACLVTNLGAVRMEPFVIGLDGLGCFDRAGVLFVTVRLTPALTALQQRVTTATEPCGFTPEKRAFAPHITLARGRGHDDARRLSALATELRRPPQFSPFLAEEFVLYQSFPGPGGSRYERRERFTLNA